MLYRTNAQINRSIIALHYYFSYSGKVELKLLVHTSRVPGTV